MEDVIHLMDSHNAEDEEDLATSVLANVNSGIKSQNVRFIRSYPFIPTNAAKGNVAGDSDVFRMA